MHFVYFEFANLITSQVKYASFRPNSHLSTIPGYFNVKKKQTCILLRGGFKTRDRVLGLRPGLGFRNPIPLQLHHRDLAMYMILSQGHGSIIVKFLFYFVPQVKISSAGD